MKNPRANVVKCYALSFSWSFLLIQAVMVPFFQSKGLTVAQIFQTQSLFALSLLLLDVPTGYFSDVFGRRRTLIIAGVFKGLGGTALVLARGFHGVLAAYVLIGIANSFLSGSDISLLYESHAEIAGDKPDAAKLRGRQYFMTYFGVTIAALLGGWLGGRSLQTAAIVNAAFAWLSLPIALSMEEPAARRLSRGGHWKNLSAVCRRLFLDDAALRGAAAMTIVYNFAPVAAMYALQNLWRELALPLVCFGYIAALQNVVSGGAGIAARPLARRLGPRATIVLIGILPVAAFLGAGLRLLAAAVLCGVLLEVLRAFVQVELLDQINAKVAPESRATANSILSFGSRSLTVAAAPALGALAQDHGAAAAFHGLLALYVAAFAALALSFIVREEEPAAALGF